MIDENIKLGEKEPFKDKKENPFKNESKDYGWICPKCGKVNAPWQSSCDCNTHYIPHLVPFPYYPAYPDYYKITWCAC